MRAYIIGLFTGLSVVGAIAGEGDIIPSCVGHPGLCRTLPVEPMLVAAPYGMSKEEFGAFIEEHVKKAMAAR